MAEESRDCNREMTVFLAAAGVCPTAGSKAVGIAGVFVADLPEWRPWP
jgi:hypothetical protein